MAKNPEYRLKYFAAQRWTSRAATAYPEIVWEAQVQTPKTVLKIRKGGQDAKD